MKNMLNVTTVLPHNLSQTNPCIRHNFSTQIFRKRAAQLHCVGPELSYIFWPFLAFFGGQKRPENVAQLRAHIVKLCRALSEDLCRNVVTKLWSHWTCSSLGTIFQPMRINSVPDVKCFCNNNNVLCTQSMAWHFVCHSVCLTLLHSFFSVYLLICYNGFTKPDITIVHHIEYDIRMLSFLILVSSVPSVWSLLTHVLIFCTFSIHYTVPNDINLIYCFCTKLMVLFTSILIIT